MAAGSQLGRLEQDGVEEQGHRHDEVWTRFLECYTLNNWVSAMWGVAASWEA